MQPNEFEKTFTEYHDLIRKEIAKDTDLENKVAKVEQLVYLMHSVVLGHFSPEYTEQAIKVDLKLRAGSYVDVELNQTVFINDNNLNTRKRRLGVLREWLSLMIREYAPFRLDGNSTNSCSTFFHGSIFCINFLHCNNW